MVSQFDIELPLCDDFVVSVSSWLVVRTNHKDTETTEENTKKAEQRHYRDAETSDFNRQIHTCADGVAG